VAKRGVQLGFAEHLTPSAAIPSLKTAEVHLTDDQKALIRQALQTG
jgi:hypothetical protein